MPAGRRPFSRPAKYFKILNSQDGLPAAIPQAGEIIEGNHGQRAESGRHHRRIATAVRHAACLRNSAHDEFSSFGGGAGELGRPVFYAGAS
jgi:hypothetical protein